jgi:undecaprenyl diphosphate synthase
MQDTFHIAIIPDGNRRWAKKHGIRGYKKLYDIAIERLVDVTSEAFDAGVTHLSLWGSSHANLAHRSTDFFHGIDMAFRTNVHKFSEHPIIEKYDIKIEIIGEWRKSLSPKTVVALEGAVRKTAHHNSRVLALLIDYSGTRERDEALIATLALCRAGRQDSELSLRRQSWTGHLPDLDLIMRTGSWKDPHNSAGFMSLLADESQLAFPSVYWPDFTREDLQNILIDYQARERRRGK